MRRVAAILLGLALVVVAGWVKAHTPDDYDHRYGPLASAGHSGAPVTAGAFTVRVDGVTVARSATPDRKEVLRPDGVFVIVTAAATIRRVPTRLATAYLRTRNGYEYRESVKNVIAENGDPLSAVALGPGLWRRGPFVFEVPPSELAGSTLVVSDRPVNEKDPPGGFPPYGFELTAQAEIALRIGEARARRLVANAPERVTIPGADS
ncbi:hypothetical protein GCM10023196_107180 [Actinoallomurus vinaceus]|uniref:Uncharacterized protein n=1 Tax=Actinoallomurus vinaceus TaxID=1080074 RepID=A0ABP8UV78_9ACTN